MIILKKFYAYGFKSYADPITINFEHSLIGVVGPNGSGKSNIIDAIRWVLGEQSLKSLRGDESDDFIFAGSKGKNPLNFAEVTLTFDNSNKSLPSDAKEIKITRKLGRGEGSSEYYINNEAARMKDIHDLFIESGLTRHSLGIISQGTVQDFANAKPEMRRTLFEQAAGVAKYKKRKVESLSKLEKTAENLSRVGDILKEIERNYLSLKKQAEKAKIYKEKKTELESFELTIIIQDLKHYRSEQIKLEKIVKEMSVSKTKFGVELEVDENQLRKINESISEIDSKITRLQTDLNVQMNSASDLEKQKSSIDAKQNASNTGDKKSRQEYLKNIISELRIEISTREKWVKDGTEEIEQLSTERTRVRNSISEGQQQALTETTAMAALVSRKEFLHELSESNSHLFEGVKNIIQNKKSIDGVYDVIAKLIEVKKEYQKAIEVAFGRQLQDIIVDTDVHAKDAIHFLKSNQGGTATFLPLNTIKPRIIKVEHFEVARQIDGFIGLASDLISYEKKYDPAIKNLIGNVIIAKDISAASTLSKLLSQGYKVITLDGDIVQVGGALTGGFNRDKKASALSLENEMKEITEILNKKDAFLRKIKDQNAENEQEYSNMTMTLEEKKISNATNIEAIRHRKDALVLHENDHNKLTGEDVSKSFKSIHETIIHQIQTSHKAMSEINEELKIHIHSKENFFHEKEKIEKRVISARSTYEKVRERLVNDTAQMEKIDFLLKQHVERLTEGYSMTEEFALENVKVKKIMIPEDKARELVKQLRKEIEQLGPVNVDVIAQYEEEATRYEKLKSQYDELREAQKELLSAIEEMDKIMIEKFSMTIEKINLTLAEVFQYLFGGGYAKIEYTNPEDILNTGIEVIANPPGKTITNLNLLSGGEKSMVVLSILFAVLKVNSLPLVILDEVESQLDPANVERFAKFLQNLKDKTQFIVISHRPGTMEQMDVLYGCTMQVKGVTKILSVKLTEALEYASDKDKKQD